MIVIFTLQETVIERALQRSLMILAPDVELRIVAWSGASDLKTLQECLKRFCPAILVVNTHGCSASQLSQLFHAGIKPAPDSLVFFGPGAEDIVKEREVLEWVGGKVTGERVLNLTSVLKLLQKPHRGSVMTFLSGCHDLKSSLKKILDDGRSPLSQRCGAMLALLENFTGDHIDFESRDDVTGFFRSFRDFLSAVISQDTEIGGEQQVLERTLIYINALSSTADMRKLVSGDAQEIQGYRPPLVIENYDAKQDKRILVSVLIVEDNHNFAAGLIERYRMHLPQVEKFNIEFVLHVPKKDAGGKVIETRQEFRERLIKRIRCESTLWQDESLTRLQAVIMDYAMDDFPPRAMRKLP